ncbi:hypothetical protein DPMN_161173 [Dreissena polymorpha]|uniref:Uncharacterized protein n=1 Tax=Dreissena polymorpha TaxID=45954 RepID=A0A9D4ESJ7_DREPO|nr:hypothetical protein DPMN_161173 [Dreissena polymorpha]
MVIFVLLEKFPTSCTPMGTSETYVPEKTSLLGRFWLEFRLGQAPESVSLAQELNAVSSEKTKRFFVHIYPLWCQLMYE